MSARTASLKAKEVGKAEGQMRLRQKKNLRLQKSSCSYE